MSSDAGTTNSGVLRVIRPGRRFIPYRAVQDEERSRLLSKIDSLYREACSRIGGGGGVPSDVARLLVSGVVVGLLDPVSNILVNTLFTSDPITHPCPAGPYMDEAKLGEMVRRSLDGLVAFLVYFFPYLAGWEAVRYLLITDADLFIATRLIVSYRGMTRFSITSPASAEAFVAALRLAAQVAGHPEPPRLVHAWMSRPSRLTDVADVLSASRMELPKLPDLREAWDLTAYRIHGKSYINIPETTRSLRMVLLDTFRCFYLRALARLPRHELRTRYHRSLLKAGYCYGPMDPVSNIILNTIWYDATFSGGERPVLDMIGPSSLTRLECRSFFGLASFIKTRYHNLSDHEITQCLVASSGFLPLADPNLHADAHLSFGDLNFSGDGAAWKVAQHQLKCGDCYDAINKLKNQSPCTRTQEAYEAAATAAWHPNPEAHAAFLSSCKAMLPVSTVLLLQGGDRLTSVQVHHITSLFSPKQPTPEPIKMKNPCPVRVGKRRSEAQQRRITAKVKAALERHLLCDGEPMYDLHIICGANEFVGSPDYGEDKEDYLPCAPCTFRYSHVNFLVTQKGSSSAYRAPILYFAEFNNGEEDKPSLCCRVDAPTPFAEHVRCLYCEGEAAKIVHPASKKFHGRDEFEDVISGKDSYTNDRLISENKYAAEKICGLEEDCMYYDVKCIS
ncbi:hypothetical protein ACQ4PT_045304 [Festuca glaucescens]